MSNYVFDKVILDNRAIYMSAGINCGKVVLQNNEYAINIKDFIPSENSFRFEVMGYTIFNNIYVGILTDVVIKNGGIEPVDTFAFNPELNAKEIATIQNNHNALFQIAFMDSEEFKNCILNGFKIAAENIR